MSISWMDYKGKKILYVDHRGSKSQDELLQTLELQEKYCRESPDKLLILYDYRDVYVDPKFMERAKKLGKEVLNAKTERSAILGVTGIRKILLDADIKFSGDNVVIFDSEPKAKEYLVNG